MPDPDQTTADILDAFQPGPAEPIDAASPSAPGAEAEVEAAVEDDATPAGAAAEDAAGDQRYLRLAADFENFRRRTAREAAERTRYAAEGAARALLPVLDNLRRAVDSAPDDTAPALLEGLRITVRQFEEALAAVGVTPIEAVGQPFDPSLHEAVMAEASPDVAADTVVSDLQRGYRLHDRVLRPSMVAVVHPATVPSEA